MIENLVRKNMLSLSQHENAYEDVANEISILLDANENPFGSPAKNEENLNRYPDPNQTLLKEKISTIKGVPPQNIFLGNGSSEVLDVLFRIFCEPAKDWCVTCPPSNSLYERLAKINDVEVARVPLQKNFDLNVGEILEHNQNTKILFLNSPNDPTGNALHNEDIEFLLGKFQGIVVIDETYINYSRQPSFISLLPHFPNLIIVQTFSKAWGLAGLHLATAYASSFIINLMNKVRPQFNINAPAQHFALSALDNLNWVNEHIRKTVALRENLSTELKKIPNVKYVYPSQANFLLVRFKNAATIYNSLLVEGIAVQDVSMKVHCENCLRITVGTEIENNILIEKLKNIA